MQDDKCTPHSTHEEILEPFIKALYDWVKNEKEQGRQLRVYNQLLYSYGCVQLHLFTESGAQP